MLAANSFKLTLDWEGAAAAAAEAKAKHRKPKESLQSFKCEYKLKNIFHKSVIVSCSREGINWRSTSGWITLNSDYKKKPKVQCQDDEFNENAIGGRGGDSGLDLCHQFKWSPVLHNPKDTSWFVHSSFASSWQQYNLHTIAFVAHWSFYFSSFPVIAYRTCVTEVAVFGAVQSGFAVAFFVHRRCCLRNVVNQNTIKREKEDGGIKSTFQNKIREKSGGGGYF